MRIKFLDGWYYFWMVFPYRKRNGVSVRVHESTTIDERLQRLFQDEGTAKDPRIGGIRFTRRRLSNRKEVNDWLRCHAKDVPLTYPVPRQRYQTAARLIGEDRHFGGNVMVFEDGRTAIRDWATSPHYVWVDDMTWVKPEIIGLTYMSPGLLKLTRKRIALNPSAESFIKRRLARKINKHGNQHN